MFYVLIALIPVSSYMASSHTTMTAEFSSKIACVAAAEWLEKTVAENHEGHVLYICTPKGAPL